MIVKEVVGDRREVRMERMLNRNVTSVTAVHGSRLLDIHTYLHHSSSILIVKAGKTGGPLDSNCQGPNVSDLSLFNGAVRFLQGDCGTSAVVLAAFIAPACSLPRSPQPSNFRMASQTESSLALLAHRDPSAPLTAYDGRVGVVIGEFIYTSPNESFIPCPILGFRRVVVREDYRFGPDDHTLWPQPYSESFPHLAAIPQQPTDSTDPLHIMWNFVSTLGQALRYTFSRLQSLAATWHDIRFTLAELQRYYLELVGLLDYMEVYKPRMDGSHPRPPTVASTIGCFTTKPRVVEEFTAAGLPVWYMRPLKNGFANNVLSIVEPIPYSDKLVTRIHGSFPVLHESNSYISTGDVVGLIHQFSRKWISTPNPFQNPTSSTNPSVSSLSSSKPPQTTTSSSSRSSGPPRKKAKISTTKTTSSSNAPNDQPQQTMRDKFAPLQGPMAPFTIPAWVDALKRVNQTQPPTISQPPRGGYYAFPDPGLFISPLSEQRRQHLIEQYCRIEDVWMSCSSTIPGSSMTNQQWRNLLTINFREPLPSTTAQADETRTMTNHREALKLLLPPNTQPAGLITPSHNASFRFWSTNAWFEAGTLPPVENIQLLLYRLYELNFRREVVMLDRYAHRGHSTPLGALSHELEIRELFPNQTYISPSMEPINTGLGADDI
ncbi:hypothetical protein BJ165DRAFT_1406053 [Panaeolus papilionaceus]|nr:hypothetical protein BJ165DRAFT_1406053 [Panaeolus papilionaceus]